MEKNMLAKGEQLWVLYSLDRANQKLVGWTEVAWNPNRPMLLNQGFTAVDAAYRNKGLGRWLKAAMMQKILEERQEVEFIRTRNANSNAPMLKINNEMGFKPYNALTAWQVNIDQVEEYLNSKELNKQ
jgi:GNAT superfamily N-acetyltransferase